MKVELLYFAALRETLGVDREHVELPGEVVDLGSLRGWLTARGGAWAEEFDPARRLMMSINQSMAGPEARFEAGDEVAFFPPVTGG